MAYEKRKTTDKLVKVEEDFYHGKNKNKLYRLTKKNFSMKTKEGQVLFYDYMIAEAKLKRKITLEKADPKARLKERIKQMEEKLAAMKEEFKSI